MFVKAIVGPWFTHGQWWRSRRLLRVLGFARNQKCLERRTSSFMLNAGKVLMDIREQNTI
jgi:hypothetical protein